MSCNNDKDLADLIISEEESLSKGKSKFTGSLRKISGTVVEILGSQYIIPTVYIKQFIRVEEGQWLNIARNQTVIKTKDGIIPVISIARLFGLPWEEKFSTESLMILLEMEQTLKAFPVSNIIEQLEIMVKPLGVEFSHSAYVSGVSILEDDRVVLILDVENIFKKEGINLDSLT